MTGFLNSAVSNNVISEDKMTGFLNSVVSNNVILENKFGSCIWFFQTLAHEMLQGFSIVLFK